MLTVKRSPCGVSWSVVYSCADGDRVIATRDRKYKAQEIKNRLSKYDVLSTSRGTKGNG